ncbi:MAG: 3-deoxy-manno-octulosonate cytidylyltransferase [Bacteroidota bacterium]
MNFIGIIPARYSSTRLPGKPLAIINGKTMIERVVEQCLKCEKLTKVVVATDDDRIFNFLNDKKINVVLTSDTHQSGTDRCFEAANKIQVEQDDVIINIQGDEPFINPKQIELLIDSFSKKEVDIATLVKQIKTTEDLNNPSIPKVVFDKNNKALLFSRSVIPFSRNVINQDEWVNNFLYYKHIGIYGYRFSVLKDLVKLPVSNLEKTESLEQLRWLENGYSIYVEKTEIESLAVDTPEDLKKANDFCVINNIK